MYRQLLLISNPGNPSDANYVEVAEKAIDRWRSFFQSPIGGNWEDGEILQYGKDHLISADELRRMMIALNTVQCDYSVIVFCGHGGSTLDGKDAIQLPIPTSGNLNLLPVDDLLGRGCDHVRRTIILDACRTLIPLTSDMLYETKQYSQIYTIDGVECGKYYNSLVMDAKPHVEVLYSTSLHQKAFATMTGSEYADAMSSYVKDNSLRWKSLAIMNKNGYFDYSMCDFQHDMITELGKRNNQLPEYRIEGKTNRNFPFIAMHLPTTRTLYNSGEIVEVIND